MQRTIRSNGAIEYHDALDNLHREDGPAVEYPNGHKVWYIHGKRHREDGPAVEFANGSKQWYIHGKRHREDGPAIEYASGTKYWFLEDKEYTQQEHMRMVKLKVFW